MPQDNLILFNFCYRSLIDSKNDSNLILIICFVAIIFNWILEFWNFQHSEKIHHNNIFFFCEFLRDVSFFSCLYFLWGFQFLHFLLSFFMKVDSKWSKPHKIQKLQAIFSNDTHFLRLIQIFWVLCDCTKLRLRFD